MTLPADYYIKNIPPPPVKKRKPAAVPTENPAKATAGPENMPPGDYYISQVPVAPPSSVLKIPPVPPVENPAKATASPENMPPGEYYISQVSVARLPPEKLDDTVRNVINDLMALPDASDEVFITRDQAFKHGIEIPDGYKVKGYGENGATMFSIIDDQGYENRLDGTVLDPDGVEVDYDEWEEEDLIDFKINLAMLFPNADTNWVNFIVDSLPTNTDVQDMVLDKIQEMGRNEITESLLRSMGADDAGIAEFFRLLEAKKPWPVNNRLEQDISPVSDTVTLGMSIPYSQTDREYTPWPETVINSLEQNISPVSDEVTPGISIPYLQMEPGMIHGLRPLNTNPEQNQFPASERVTAAYTPSLAYLAEHPEQGKIENILNNTVFAFVETAYNTEQAFVHTFPNLFWPDVKAGDKKHIIGASDKTTSPQNYFTWAEETYTQEEADAENKKNKVLRDTFRTIYLKNKQEHEDWLKKHPEFAPLPEFQGDLITQIRNNPGDTGYILLNSFATTLPEFLAILGGTAASIITENPIPLFVAIVAVTPSRIEETNNILLEHGATESQSAEISLVIGIISGALDLMPAGKLIDSMSPTAMELFTKTFTEETAKLVSKDVLKQGLKKYTEAEALQIVTGIAQQALQNTAVKLVDPEYSLFKDMIDEAVNSGLQGLPVSLFGP